MRFLHFGNEPQQPDDHLGKVRFLINHLNNAMPEIYTPHKKLSLDESMMLWGWGGVGLGGVGELINVLAIHDIQET